MTSVRALANTALRDFNTDGVAASGVHAVVKSDLRQLMELSDGLQNGSAISATTTAQPGSPSVGDTYILPTGKTGAAWAGMTVGSLAFYLSTGWLEVAPLAGWRCFVQDQLALFVFHGAAWNRIAAYNERRVLFTPGGDGVVSIYRVDTARVQNPRAATISSVASDVITLTTSDAGLFFSSLMAGVCYARIWNTSKTPNQSAWVKAVPGANQLQVVSAAAISSWVNTETIQIGDPTDQTPNRVVALDISPMMQTVLGRVFRQAGLIAKVQAQANTANYGQFDLTPDGVTGSFQSVKSFGDATLNPDQLIVSCTQLSPISNSNLIFVRETVTGTNMLTASASVVGVLL